MTAVWGAETGLEIGQPMAGPGRADRGAGETGGRMRKTEQRDWGNLIMVVAMMNLKDPHEDTS